MSLSILSVKVPRESENTPEQTAQLLASLAKATRSPDFLGRLSGSQPVYLSLEVTLLDGQVSFAIVFPKVLDTFIRSQVHATYPDAVLTEIPDYLKTWFSPSLAIPPPMSVVRQAAAAYFPLRDYADYTEVDPMLPTLGVLSKATEKDKILIQYVLAPAPASFQSQANAYLHPSPRLDEQGKTIKDTPEGKKLIEDKFSQPLVTVSIRFASTRPELLNDLAGAISVLNRPDGNSLTPAPLFPWYKNRLWDCILFRTPFKTFNIPTPVLNVMELSSLWHLPGVYTKIQNVAWSPSTSFVEAPENLPVSSKGGQIVDFQNADTPADQAGHASTAKSQSASPNEDINFFAKTVFRNQEAIFGLKLEDRLRHVYILGKSGTGKSTLLENMAVDDFKKGRGVAFLDPHGDSAEALLDYIPSSRINDTIYFNPADRQHPIALNILEVYSPDQAELVASGIVSIFHKLYGNSWGPRLEYILRNTLLSLTCIPDSTLPDVIRALTDLKFRKKFYPALGIQNPRLLSFWTDEFDPLEERTRLEHISPVLNKVGQFVNSPLISNLISHPKSTIDLAEVLNSGKILIANLSQGKLGQDNATLLGAMLITQLELAAMTRIDMPKEKRHEFFLYVDEFQNFATESFIKILSEARKFRLGLVLANQYIAQIPEEIQKAIFGNAGTVLSFVMGAEDSRVMESEFGSKFSADSLVSLQKYQIAIKMMIDQSQSQPFLATSLPPLKSKNKNRDKVIAQSQSRYSKKLSTPPPPSASRPAKPSKPPASSDP